MSGPAWIVRNRIAIPPAQKKPQKLTSSGEREEADEIDGAAADVHPDRERDHGEQHGDERPADERRERVARARSRSAAAPRA